MSRCFYDRDPRFELRCGMVRVLLDTIGPLADIRQHWDGDDRGFGDRPRISTHPAALALDVANEPGRHRRGKVVLPTLVY